MPPRITIRYARWLEASPSTCTDAADADGEVIVDDREKDLDVMTDFSSFSDRRDGDYARRVGVRLRSSSDAITGDIRISLSSYRKAAAGM